MSEFTSGLVKDTETGEICLQVRYQSFTATLPLPDNLAQASPERLKEFADNVIPEMVTNLRNMKVQDDRERREKLKKKLRSLK